MDSARWDRIQTLFHEAVELPESQRQAFLQNACADDDALIAEVLAMLREDQRGASLLDSDVANLAQSLVGNGARPTPVPQEFGPYRLGRMLGEGGMGVVYLAERADLGSLVAIKILRDAWLSPARRERFLSEQRTLAQLNHPSIARLYDADTLPDGTPWFVMEYVDGLPLTEYWGKRESTIAERLRSFRAVCEAVQHAHEHAIIHRDLKPSNILVTAEGTVKLLDFGIAKQLDSEDKSVDQTLTGLRLMTPAYAAPEQIRGGPLGVYTDVYALGVILYELLAGRPPFDFSGTSPTEAAAIITDRQPERPSAFAKRSEGKTAWADLDVLCLTAMHKDPERRYRSIEALIRDIDHFLNGEPLEARPDSARYRLGKFAGRHRGALTATMMVAAVMAVLIVFFTVRLAVARSRVLSEAARTQRIQAFMLNLFGDSSAGPADDLRVVTLLDRGVSEARLLDREPAVQAALYYTLGGLYQKLGKLDQADTLLSLALERRRAIFGRENAEVAQSLVAMGELRIEQGRLADAEKMAREGLAMSRRTLPADDPALARAQMVLGRVQEHRGNYKEAAATLEEAVRMQSGHSGVAADLATSLSELANTQFYAGNYKVSDALNRRVLAMHQQIYGGRHPAIADDYLNLASIQNNLGHYPEAEAFDRQALDINRSWYGNNHPETGSSLNYLGQALVMQHRYAEAEDMLQQSLAIQEHVYGPVHSRVAVAVNELGLLAMKRGNLEEAEKRFRRAVDIDRAVYGDHHQAVALETTNLASVYLEMKQYGRAERLFQEALACYRQVLPPGHQNIAIAEVKLGRTLLFERRFGEAESHMLAAYRIVNQQASPSLYWLKTVKQDLVGLYEAMGQPDKAAQFK